MYTGGIRTLKVVKRGDRFRILLFDVIRIRDFELRFFGVRVKRVLVEEIVVRINRCTEIFFTVRLIRFVIVLFGRKTFFYCRASPEKQESCSPQEKQGSCQHEASR